MVNKVVKLGLLFDNNKIPTWMYESLKRVLGYDFVDLSLVISSPKSKTESSSKLYNLYKKVDEKLFLSENSATELKNYQPLVEDIESVEISEVEKIESFELDIIVNLSTLLDVTSLISCAKLGIYSFVGVDEYRYLKMCK